MANLLLISDDLRRTGRLARDLGAAWACHACDLYDDAPTPGTPDLIVSDVKSLTSDAIQRLRRLLERIRGPTTPYLCLLHDDGARARIHSDLLGASGTLSASATSHLLVSTLSDLLEQVGPAPATARRHADTAWSFLRETFVPDRPITPALMDVGTGIVADAVREVGIRAWVPD